MNFENELIPGVLIKRYKRFFVDIKVKNKIITAHCPNSGSMMGLLKKGNKVWFTESNNKKRKLKYTVQIIEVDGKKVGVNTHLTNKIVLEALKKNYIKELPRSLKIYPEQKFGDKTRFDFLINEENCKSYLEVKNVTLVRSKNIAEFPDAITERGKKHLKELTKAIQLGYKSYILYVIQREDCKMFKIASDIDPEYFEILTNSIGKNVKVLCYDCKFYSKGIKLNKQIKLKINE
ncbi:MAG: DNA/RNA nuclease SfsA [Pelagibacterales bacterium MED-G40]|nr:MAG: DNA/RNA nuclease SfsA [Pelagibacterales bacterium MED-G40]|tara:strand:- start:17 stop:718 length:702 start_codon:yes stop_codon:yes gene_type:complete